MNFEEEENPQEKSKDLSSIYRKLDITILLVILLLITSQMVTRVVKYRSSAQSANYVGGYVFPVSAKWGEKVDFFLSTTAGKAKLEIFRQGVVQEKVAEISNLSGSYIPCGHHSEIGCFYPKIYSLTLNSNYKPGLYLAKFINQSNPSEVDLAYFVVKSDVPGSWSKIAVVLPFNTWEVHNFREGRKVYPSPHEPGYEDRARSGSFLRPWLDMCDNLEIGYPIGGPAYIWWLESQGYSPEYLTDVDLDKDQQILSHYQLGISIAHHEYWSYGMRDAVENYINSGGNFMFLSGNVSWWQVRYEDDRSLIRVYKLKEEDPYYLGSDPANDKYVTVNWYDNPVFRPETMMTGTSWYYAGFWEPGKQPYDTDIDHPPGFKVYRTTDPKWSWIFNGTGLKDGDRIGAAMFQSMVEVDGTAFNFVNGLPVVADTGKTKTPTNFTILGVSNPARHGAAIGPAVMGVRETAGGGIVFTGSQEYFSASLAWRDPSVEKIILNLLAKLAPGQQKDKPVLPYSSGGLKVMEINPSAQSGEVMINPESCLCSLNSDRNIYWAWVLTDQADNSGSFNYSFANTSSWFSLKTSADNLWTQITDFSTGKPKSFNLDSGTSYVFKFSPRFSTAKIKKIIITNTEYFYPSRFQYENRAASVINLPSQTITDLQPQFASIVSDKDGYVNSWYPTDNFGTNAYIQVKNDNVFKSLVGFDLSFLPAGAKINRAFLRLYLNNNSNGSSFTVGVASLKKDWLEQEVNWQQAKNNLSWSSAGATGQEDYDASLFAKEDVQTAGQLYYFDVTALLRNFASSPSAFKGFLLSSLSPWAGSTVLSFAGREYSLADYRPTLEINYVASGGQITPTATQVSATPTGNLPRPTATPTLNQNPPSGKEATIVLQPGVNNYSGMVDTYVKYGESDCQSSSMIVGYKQQNTGFIRFNLASVIPDSSEILNAKLSLYAAGWGGTDISLNLFKALESWNACQTNGSVIKESSALASGRTNGVRQWYEFDLTSAVKGWFADPSTNYGIVIGQADAAASSLYFASSESGVATRPKLTITYRYTNIPAEPTLTLTPTVTPRPTSILSPTSTPVPASTLTPTPRPSPTSTPVPNQTTTVTFQQGTGGYSGAKDTYFYIYDSNNYCQETNLKVGYKQQNVSLLSFDLSSISSGAVITNAKLQLYATGWGGTDITLNFYKVLRSWNDCQTTWNKADSGTNWAAGGASGATDRAGTPMASFATHSVPKWYEIDLSSLVQEWVSNSANNKGVLIGGGSEASAFYFTSAEGDAANRPKLVVTYR